MVHAVQHVGEHLFHRSERAVGYDPLDLGRQFQPAHHADRRAPHGVPMEQDLSVFAHLLRHPFHPAHPIEPVHIAEADMLSLTFSVGPQVDEQHPEPVLQIIMGKAAIVIQPFARIPVETDHCLASLIAFEICTVELQAVVGGDPHILMRLLHHPFPALFHHGNVFLPVHAGHLHRAFCLRVIADHGPPVKVGAARRLRCCRRSEKRCRCL